MLAFCRALAASSALEARRIALIIGNNAFATADLVACDGQPLVMTGHGLLTRKGRS